VKKRRRENERNITTAWPAALRRQPSACGGSVNLAMKLSGIGMSQIVEISA